MMGNWGFNSQQRCDFSLLCNVQTGSGTLPTSYSVATIVFFLDIEWLGCETGYSSPSSSEVMIRLSKSPTSPYINIAWCVVKLKGNITLLMFSIVWG